MDIKRVGVVGCGLMGHGIAQVSAQSGYDVVAGWRKSRQDGFVLNAQIGQTDHDDGFAQDYNVSWGVSSDNTRIVVGGLE